MNSAARPARDRFPHKQGFRLSRPRSCRHWATSLRGRVPQTTKRKRGGRIPKTKSRLQTCCTERCLRWTKSDFAEAVPQLEEVLKEEPDLALANLDLGRALNGLEKYAQALPWLQKAVELNPQSGRAHFELGVALGETGDWAGSAVQLESAVSKAPDSDDLHFYLAMAYDKLRPGDRRGKEFPQRSAHQS